MEQSPVAGVNDRLRKINAYLSFCEDLIEDGGISAETIQYASLVNARTDLSIAEAEAFPTGSPGFDLLPNGTARIRTSSTNPFTTRTENSAGSFELADVSVTVNDKSALVLSVSPTELVIVVPADAAGGIASVAVTSREGFIHSDVASVAGLNPRIFARNGDSIVRGIVVDALNLLPGDFSVDSPLVIGLDGRRRVSILASGISTGLANLDQGNDLWLRDGRRLENLAESVSVEARTSAGQVFYLPVEYAGWQGDLRGLDQVTIIVLPEVAGAGPVQLTIVAGGVRSNTMTVALQ